MNNKLLLILENFNHLEVVVDFADIDNGIYQVEYDNFQYSEEEVRRAVSEFIETALLTHIEERDIEVDL